MQPLISHVPVPALAPTMVADALGLAADGDLADVLLAVAPLPAPTAARRIHPGTMA